jgi:hypothetical protein
VSKSTGEMSKSVVDWSKPVEGMSSPIEISKLVELSKAIELGKPVELSHIVELSKLINSSSTKDVSKDLGLNSVVSNVTENQAKKAYDYLKKETGNFLLNFTGNFDDAHKMWEDKYVQSVKEGNPNNFYLFQTAASSLFTTENAPTTINALTLVTFLPFKAAVVAGTINEANAAKLVKEGKIVFEKVAAKTGTSLWPAASEGRTVINGIEYTTHALERMQPVGTIMKGTTSVSRGVPPSIVENTIKFGKVTPGNTAAEVVRTFDNVRVITNPEGTRVISVIKIGN